MRNLLIDISACLLVIIIVCAISCNNDKYTSIPEKFVIVQTDLMDSNIVRYTINTYPKNGNWRSFEFYDKSGTYKEGDTLTFVKLPYKKVIAYWKIGNDSVPAVTLTKNK